MLPVGGSRTSAKDPIIIKIIDKRGRAKGRGRTSIGKCPQTARCQIRAVSKNVLVGGSGPYREHPRLFNQINMLFS